jgi:predicted ATPase
MISKLEIHNYKSLNELTLEVGRFNVLIGENGCGKSNLLEAIALVAAAASNKLDNEFLASRGIRVTEPKLMRSAFNDENLSKSIKVNLNFNFDNTSIAQFYEFSHNNQPYSKWLTIESRAHQMVSMWHHLFKNSEISFDEFIIANDKYIDYVSEKFFDGDKITAKNYLMRPENKVDNENEIFRNFLIYSPENTALRNFSKEGQIEPLGIHGEGLLKLLKVIKNNSPEQWQEIQDSLELFDWFDGIELPDLSSNDDQVSITDRYLTQVIDQRSANEGFLFVLFYIALMVSEYTPKIFAIENIDTSLNPKLCTKLIKVLINLAKKYDKQVFVTTHNPAILDGINLGDDEQRLLVVSRNKLGHTNFKRIELADKPRSSNNEDLKLSEAFLRGYLGGLPKGF